MGAKPSKPKATLLNVGISRDAFSTFVPLMLDAMMVSPDGMVIDVALTLLAFLFPGPPQINWNHMATLIGEAVKVVEQQQAIGFVQTICQLYFVDTTVLLNWFMNNPTADINAVVNGDLYCAIGTVRDTMKGSTFAPTFLQKDQTSTAAVSLTAVFNVIDFRTLMTVYALYTKTQGPKEVAIALEELKELMPSVVATLQKSTAAVVTNYLRGIRGAHFQYNLPFYPDNLSAAPLSLSCNGLMVEDANNSRIDDEACSAAATAMVRIRGDKTTVMPCSNIAARFKQVGLDNGFNQTIFDPTSGEVFPTATGWNLTQFNDNAQQMSFSCVGNERTHGGDESRGATEIPLEQLQAAYDMYRLTKLRQDIDLYSMGKVVALAMAVQDSPTTTDMPTLTASAEAIMSTRMKPCAMYPTFGDTTAPIPAQRSVGIKGQPTLAAGAAHNPKLLDYLEVDSVGKTCPGVSLADFLEATQNTTETAVTLLMPPGFVVAVNVLGEDGQDTYTDSTQTIYLDRGSTYAINAYGSASLLNPDVTITVKAFTAAVVENGDIVLKFDPTVPILTVGKSTQIITSDAAIAGSQVSVTYNGVRVPTSSLAPNTTGAILPAFDGAVVTLSSVPDQGDGTYSFMLSTSATQSAPQYLTSDMDTMTYLHATWAGSVVSMETFNAQGTNTAEVQSPTCLPVPNVLFNGGPPDSIESLTAYNKVTSLPWPSMFSEYPWVLKINFDTSSSTFTSYIIQGASGDTGLQPSTYGIMGVRWMLYPDGTGLHKMLLIVYTPSCKIAGLTAAAPSPNIAAAYAAAASIAAQLSNGSLSDPTNPVFSTVDSFGTNAANLTAAISDEYKRVKALVLTAEVQDAVTKLTDTLSNVVRGNFTGFVAHYKAVGSPLTPTDKANLFYKEKGLTTLNELLANLVGGTSAGAQSLSTMQNMAGFGEFGAVSVYAWYSMLVMQAYAFADLLWPFGGTSPMGTIMAMRGVNFMAALQSMAASTPPDTSNAAAFDTVISTLDALIASKDPDVYKTAITNKLITPPQKLAVSTRLFNMAPRTRNTITITCLSIVVLLCVVVLVVVFMRQRRRRL